ncbi:MAG: DUF6883 domain-containing protein [Gammaproteobacteria bacterium]
MKLLSFGTSLSTGHPEGPAQGAGISFCPGPNRAGRRGVASRSLRRGSQNEAIVADRDAYGQRYVVDFVMRRGGREATVRSTWIIRTLEDFPRLTSCFVL